MIEGMETRAIKDLVPYDKNPRNNKKAVDRVLESLNRHGQVKPIVLSAKGHPFEQEVICAGHTTMQALKRFGAKEAKVVVKEFVDEAQFVDYNIRDNKAGEFAEWDEALLGQLAGEFEVDLGEMGFDFEMEGQENEGLTDEDEVPEAPEDPVAKLGQMWKLGEHRLMCGDSTDREQVERLMGGEKADMVFTDPPYNVAGESKNFASDVSKSMAKLKDSDWDYGFDTDATCSMCNTFSKNDSTVYIWTNNFLFGEITDNCQDWADFVGYCVWAKPNPMPSLSKRHWTWNTELCVYATKGSKRTVNFPDGEHALSCWTDTKKSDGSHPTQKPLEICERPILFSSGDGDLILDLFGGSGSTLIACEKTGRKCRMMELDPKYCDVIIKRWEDFTGGKAELISDSSDNP